MMPAGKRMPLAPSLMGIVLAGLFTALVLAAGVGNAAGEKIPRLVDLGADKCIPCKMMAPILEELGRDYTGRFDVVFIDVWKDRDQARAYGVQLIPTQIFYGSDGRELYRHQGFYSREEILAKWQELGFDFSR